MLSQTFLDEMKLALLKKKQQLENDLQNLSAHTELGDSEDDNAEEVPMDEVNQDLIATMKAGLEKVENALAKIDAGTYGVDESGQKISEDRLRALPWADKAI